MAVEMYVWVNPRWRFMQLLQNTTIRNLRILYPQLARGRCICLVKIQIVK